MSLIQNSRMVEMIQAESARVGNTPDTSISPDSPPLLKASVMANFFIQLEMILAVAEATKSAKDDLRQALKFVFVLFPGASEILKGDDFPRALEALRKDYLDAMQGRM